MCQIIRHMVARRLRNDCAPAITCTSVTVKVDSSLVRRPEFSMVRLCHCSRLHKELLLQIVSAQKAALDRGWKGSHCAAVHQSQIGGSTHISVVQMTSRLDSVYL